MSALGEDLQVDVAGADDEPLLTVQVLARKRHTVGGLHFTREERRLRATQPPPVYPDGVERPLTRGDCEGGARPCPWVSCAHHLYLDVLPSGSIKFNFPELEPWELRETCALDVADRGGETLEAVGRLLSLTRERVRQVEQVACRKVRRGAANDIDP